MQVSFIKEKLWCQCVFVFGTEVECASERIALCASDSFPHQNKRKDSKQNKMSNEISIVIPGSGN